MAVAISNVFQFSSNSRLSPNNTCSNLSPPFLRFARCQINKNKSFTSGLFSQRMIVSAASSAAGSPSSENDFNPYEVLGVNPIEGFDMVKAAYTRKKKDAERRGDEAAAARLEKAYDKLMMAQLSNRKKGVTYGSFQVSKDIKYADKQPIIPWGPRFTKSEVKDIRINMAISAAFIAWIVVARSADWKPVQFLSFVFVYRIFEKLKAYEPPVSTTFTEEGEDEGRMMRMGKRLLRSLALAFGCIAFASLGYTGIVNLIEFISGYVPVALYNNQVVKQIPVQYRYLTWDWVFGIESAEFPHVMEMLAL
ncbi:chloroplast J-like domain protein 1 [Tanacetum coccineum]